jgi:serpin B
MARRDSLKLLGLVGAGAAIAAGFGCAEAIPPSAGLKERAMATSTTEFGYDLFGKLREKAGNLFFSPLSIETALAMTSGGARGETLAEMSKVLHLPADSQAAIGGLLQSLRAGPQAKYDLAIANALWMQQGLAFRPEFLAETQKNYEAAMRVVDFRQTEKARQTINRWVAEQTKDKIKELFAPGSLTADGSLVLTNAIYFKGKWATPFDKKATQDEPFHVSGDKTIQAPLMRRSGRFRYVSGDGVQAVEMPYAGDRITMLVVLPAAPDGLPALEKSLTADRFSGWVDRLAYKPGQVLLPRFKATDEFDLSQTLQEMGMKQAFTGSADFSGMCAEPIMISKVVHKAFVETNEEGSEAAAATGVAMVKASAPLPQEPFVFRADRPFLFVIRDTTTGTPLFVGRIVNPNS